MTKKRYLSWQERDILIQSLECSKLLHKEKLASQFQDLIAHPVSDTQDLTAHPVFENQDTILDKYLWALHLLVDKKEIFFEA